LYLFVGAWEGTPVEPSSQGTIAKKRVSIMSTRRLQLRIYWALAASIILIALWALGASYASDAPSTPKKQEGVVIKVNVNLVTTDGFYRWQTDFRIE
jgi:hypothetical protein